MGSERGVERSASGLGGAPSAHEAARMMELYERIARRRRRERSFWRRALPVGVSILAHAALLVLTAAVAWQVTHARPRRETIVSFDDPAFGAPPPPAPRPQTPSAEPPMPSEETVAAASVSRPDLRALAGEGDADSEVAAAEDDPLAGVDPFAARPLLGMGEGPEAAVAPVLGEVRFVGVGAANARSVVYVVDASGPMVSSFPMVKERLLASVDRLRPTQRFGVVAFRRIAAPAGVPLGGGGAGGDEPNGVEVFSPRLVRATTGAKARLREWLDGIDARGRSAPLDGLRAGLALKGDAVFLLSRGIERSGGGVWGLGLEATLAELERLNPANRRGERPATIKAIQFLDEDPTGIMRAIAARHGGGAADGYTVIESMEQLEEAE